ncbi:helix-turn-helix domain-containing protein [Flavobacterium sp. WC2421]|uniref:helix-turn-helix domain-containing protein n=1 Tax=Flavobacterium sp. WC2421 TaxID=3234138 RepID=UPI0034666B5A
MEKQILLSCISPDELKQLIKEVIKEEFMDFKKNLEIKSSDILLTRSETCEFLKIDSSTLWSWTNKGKITCYGIGARRYYKKDDILKSMLILKKTNQ